MTLTLRSTTVSPWPLSLSAGACRLPLAPALVRLALRPNPRGSCRLVENVRNLHVTA